MSFPHFIFRLLGGFPPRSPGPEVPIHHKQALTSTSEWWTRVLFFQHSSNDSTYRPTLHLPRFILALLLSDHIDATIIILVSGFDWWALIWPGVWRRWVEIATSGATALGLNKRVEPDPCVGVCHEEFRIYGIWTFWGIFRKIFWELEEVFLVDNYEDKGAFSQRSP